MLVIPSYPKCPPIHGKGKALSSWLKAQDPRSSLHLLANSSLDEIAIPESTAVGEGTAWCCAITHVSYYAPFSEEV